LSGNHVMHDAHCGPTNCCCSAVCKGCRRRATPLKPVAAVSSQQVCRFRTVCCSLGSQSVSHRSCCCAGPSQQADHSRHTTTTCRDCAVVQISRLVQVCCSYTLAQGSTHCIAVSSYCSTDGPNLHITALKAAILLHQPVANAGSANSEHRHRGSRSRAGTVTTTHAAVSLCQQPSAVLTANASCSASILPSAPL